MLFESHYFFRLTETNTEQPREDKKIANFPNNKYSSVTKIYRHAKKSKFRYIILISTRRD